MLLSEYITQNQTIPTASNAFSEYINQRPFATSAPGATEDMPISGKLGLCGQAMKKDQFKHVNSKQVSWWYNYYTWIPEDDQITWANENGIQFAPMLGYHKVKTEGWKSCEMGGKDYKGNPATKCTVEGFVQQLKDTQAKLDVPMEYLLGFNEPWDGNKALPEKYVWPHDAAKYWGEYYIPTAKELGLKLVSPSSIMVKYKAQWMIDFFKACWELKDAETGACDVTSVEVFAMHHYTCYYKDYLNMYDVESTAKTSYYQYLIDGLTDPTWEGSTQFDWDTFIRGIPIWFTETSCESEHWPDKVSNVDQCKRITGQETTGKWGPGSIEALKELDNVHRIAWFVAYSTVKDFGDTVMFDTDGELLPVARAIFNDLDPTKADCDAEPTELHI